VHESIAMNEVQERRVNKQIPGAGRLHEYANLYLHAHNAMLSRRRALNNSICVLQVSPIVFDLPGVIVADQNAASDWASFWPVTVGLTFIDRDRLFARFWKHPDDLIDEWRYKSQKCAEVLIPDSVEPELIIGAYVANKIALAAFEELDSALPVCIHGDMFF
jgi:hypothetical protein